MQRLCRSGAKFALRNWRETCVRAIAMQDAARTSFSAGNPLRMALSHRLEFCQTQSLVMTPQLMQAIKLLQLSNLDLAAYVDAELERNPMLDRAEADTGEFAENTSGEM